MQTLPKICSTSFYTLQGRLYSPKCLFWGVWPKPWNWPYPIPDSNMWVKKCEKMRKGLFAFNTLFYLSKEHGKNSPEEDSNMYVETPSSPQLLVPGILHTECLMCPTDANVNVSQSSESTSITPPAIVNSSLTCNGDQAGDEESERDSVTHEPTCSISNNIERFHVSQINNCCICFWCIHCTATAGYNGEDDLCSILALTFVLKQLFLSISQSHNCHFLEVD